MLWHYRYVVKELEKGDEDGVINREKMLRSKISDIIKCYLDFRLPTTEEVSTLWCAVNEYVHRSGGTRHWKVHLLSQTSEVLAQGWRLHELTCVPRGGILCCQRSKALSSFVCDIWWCKKGFQREWMWNFESLTFRYSTQVSNPII